MEMKNKTTLKKNHVYSSIADKTFLFSLQTILKKADLLKHFYSSDSKTVFHSIDFTLLISLKIIEHQRKIFASNNSSLANYLEDPK